MNKKLTKNSSSAAAVKESVEGLLSETEGSSGFRDIVDIEGDGSCHKYVVVAATAGGVGTIRERLILQQLVARLGGTLDITPVTDVCDEIGNHCRFRSRVCVESGPRPCSI